VVTEKEPDLPQPYEPSPENVPDEPYRLVVVPYQPPPQPVKSPVRGGVVVAAVVGFVLFGFVVIAAARNNPDNEPTSSRQEAAAPVTTPAVRTLETLPARAEFNLGAYEQGALTSIYFANDSAETVTVNWISDDKERVRYTELKPGKGYSQQTYAGHVWVIARADGTTVAVFKAVEQPGLAEIR
jgi:hypothetical protein